MQQYVRYHDYCDEVEMCAESSEAHPKSAIQVRNQSMIDRADLVVCCIQHKTSVFEVVQGSDRLPSDAVHNKTAFTYRLPSVTRDRDVCGGNR